jgi:hypothetical protein
MPSELTEVMEEFALPRSCRALVVRMASRFFVLRGARSEPLRSYEVSIPFEERCDASRAAQTLMRSAYSFDDEAFRTEVIA